MNFSKNPHPTESELEVLQILWERGQASVREVNDQLNLKREVGYTTTLKIMQIMTDKGLVKRNTESRSHIYMANVSEENTQQGLLKKFIDKTYKGSAMSLVVQALGSKKASKTEIEELKKLIENLENDKNA